MRKRLTNSTAAKHTELLTSDPPRRYLSAASHFCCRQSLTLRPQCQDKKEHKWNDKKENFQRQFELLHYRRENICHGSVEPRECTRKSGHTNPQTHNHPHRKEDRYESHQTQRQLSPLRGLHSTVKETFWYAGFVHGAIPSHKLIHNPFQPSYYMTTATVHASFHIFIYFIFYSANAQFICYFCCTSTHLTRALVVI